MRDEISDGKNGQGGLGWNLMTILGRPGDLCEWAESEDRLLRFDDDTSENLRISESLRDLGE